MQVSVLDYGAGNIRSVLNALRLLGANPYLIREPEDILSAERLVFPGVGNFGTVMEGLRRKGFAEALKEYLFKGRPFLGICLGLQVLFEGSEEAPGVPGLGVIPGFVKRFRVGLPVPHIGWNGIKPQVPSQLFFGLEGDEKFYFVHSFFVEPERRDVVLTLTDYGQEFVSAIQVESLVAVQFHPEKSGRAGLKFLENFLNLRDRPRVLPKRRLEKTKLAKRIIACLDVRADDEGRLVVTKGLQYDVREGGRVRRMGDPVELAHRYYEEGADEITFLNITGFRDFPLKDIPMLEVLRKTSEKVFVPLTIGGGIREFTDRDGTHYSALEVADAYFRAGADKVSIGSDAVYIVERYLREGARGDSSVELISKVYGKQAVVISVDPKRRYVRHPSETPHPTIETEIPGPNGERYCWFQCTVKGGREERDVDAVTLAKVCEELGAGEILLNSIDRDGTNLGYDIELVRAVSEAVNIPVIASSGAGRAEHFLEVFAKTKAEAALAAGIFHRREVTIPELKTFLLKNGIEVRKS